MNMHRKQNGISLVGFLITLTLLGFFAFVAMRLFPVYSEFQSVKSDMKALSEAPGAAKMSPAALKDALDRRFYISYVKNVAGKDLVVDRKLGVNITLDYEVRRPLMGNLDFVAKFNHTVKLAE